MNLRKSAASLLAAIVVTAGMTSAPAYAGAGGKSASHMSAEGHINTNGHNSTDRDFGRDRASDRAHLHGKSLLAPGHNK